jgi:catecholate siderophore receptor
MYGSASPIRFIVRSALGQHAAAAVGITCIAILPAHAQHAQPKGSTPSDTVLIEGMRIVDYGTETSSVSKLTEALRDTPQTITTVRQEEMSDRSVSTINDALRTVPGITLGAGETSWQGTNLFLRGFTTRNDMFLDGMRDFGYYYRDPFNDASIEVLKGPASILFGRGSTGGVIEQVSKPVVQQRHVSGSLQFGTDDTRRATLDVGGGLPALNETAGFRLNAMFHDSEVADRDGAENERWGIAPSLALGLGTPTRVVFNYLHQDDDIRPDYGLPWMAGRPAPVKRSNFYGFDSDYLDTTVDIGTLHIEHDFDPSLSIRNQTRYSRAERAFRITEPTVPAGTPAGMPVEDVTLTRIEFEGYSTDSMLQNQTDLTARFAIGGMRHTLVTGVELSRDNPRPVYVSNSGLPTTNLADPPPQDYTVALSYPRLAARTVANGVAAYALDTMKLDEHWQLILGARWDRLHTRYRSVGYSPTGDVIATTSIDRTDQAPSYRAALVYKPLAAGTFYLSYGNSFNPSAEGIESMVSSGRALGQANRRLDPENSHAYELGTKWELAGGQVLLSGSIFRIEKTNARVPDPDMPGFNTLGGDQRVDGLEVELVGRLTSFWNLRSGYAHLDSEVARTTPGGPLPGAPLPMTPKHTASVWNEWLLPHGFALGLGAVHVSSRLGQNTASAHLVAPGYTTVDVMAKYTVSRKVRVQLNLNNLTDEYYFDQLHPFHVVPGAGRTALASIELQY